MFPAITVGGQDGVAVGRGRRRAPTARAAAVDVKHVVHGTKKALHSVATDPDCRNLAR